MPLGRFHSAVERWFSQALGEPTEPQKQGWPAIASGKHTLIAAPTGSGKTLAAFLASIDELVKLGLAGELRDETRVLYVSPLKALSNDIHKNLQVPLAGIREELAAEGLPTPEIRVAVRTGDTPSSQRQAMIKKPPHIFVTTPESLYILLTSEGGRKMLRTVRTVIVDEIHAIADDKRGSHLSLSLERLEHLVAQEYTDDEGTLFPRVNGSRRLVRVGLSATQRPIERVAQFLTGSDGGECTIVDTGHRRTLDLALELTGSPLESVMPAEVWTEIYERLVELIRSHKSTLIFVNTRRLSERLTAQLADRLGDDAVTSHHGSLSKEHRLDAEQRLKAGKLSALVATASLELGIDIGDVDLVIQIGTPRSIATLLQRVGRSGHAVGAVPKGRVFPLTRDELVECSAILWAIRKDELDRLEVPVAPLDILAQQIVAESANGEWHEDDLFQMVRRAWPYRELSRKSFDEVVRMLAEGFSTRRGRRGAQIHRDAVNKRIKGRRGARLAAITSGGAIPDNADYYVVLEPTETIIGTINEDFAIESMPGDIFQLGNHSWQILKVDPGKVRVRDAEGQPPTLPFWLGEAPSRTAETSKAVSDLRAEVAARLPDGPGDSSEARKWVMQEVGIDEEATRQLVDYLHAAHAALGTLPTQDTLVIERFFDESGGMQLVVHSPFGGRLNRAWGLSLRKKFCQSFNFELQAAATEDAIVLSLGPTHSFPLLDAFKFVHSNTARETLTQAMLDAPMFPTRWRWNASRALAILRWRSGKRVAPALQRMNADDLLAVVFPDSLACFENITGGKREIPDHPLVSQTVHDCLTEAMDIDGFEGLLREIEAGHKQLIARDLREPSPLAGEILNARPYAFLDDAPLEERRTQAVISRRWMDPEAASELGQLDQAAIDRVREETWPTVRDADELHEGLLLLGYATDDEVKDNEWLKLMSELQASRRAGRVVTDTDQVLWVTAERLPQVQAVVQVRSLEPEIEAPLEFIDAGSEGEALVELVRGRLEGLTPTTQKALAESLGIDERKVEVALLTLEGEGFAFQGQFTPGTAHTEWAERRLLARIHRYTLQRLRKEIQPVSAADYMRFLFRWQHVTEGEKLDGPDSVGILVDQLQGYEAAAGAWESEIFPARIRTYDPSWLDALCLSGQVVWGRMSGREGGSRGPVRGTPLSLMRRADLTVWQSLAARDDVNEEELSANARAVYRYLKERGASFFAELPAGAHLIKTQVEEALGELVAAGVVTADSFTGLRALLVPAQKRDRMRRRNGRRRMTTAVFDIQNAGRWSLFVQPDGNAPVIPVDEERSRQRRFARFYSRFDPEVVDAAARVLLKRYGVVFRKLLERERLSPGWGDLLRAYRMMEARGEVRGGRFVSGFSGEQFALPEAVGLVRSVRKEVSAELVCISASDPLNLTGVITPGDRITAKLTNQILYQKGIPVAALENGELRMLTHADIGVSEAQIKSTLVRRPVPPKLRQYLPR